MTQQQMSIDQKAMLVELTISQWGASKIDKVATKKTIVDNEAQKDAGRFTKTLVAKAALARVRSAANAIRSYFREYTMPWDDKGARLLPAASFYNFTERMRKLTEQFNAAVDSFCIDYPNLVEQAKLSLGKMYQGDEYPHVTEIRGKFGIKLDINPLPVSNDFRVALSGDETKAIKADIEARAEQRIQKAMNDLWARLYEVVSNMATILSDPDKGFHKTLIGNVRDLVAILPSMNIMEDPELEDMTRRVEKMIGVYEAADIKADPVLRKDKADEAKAILDKMAGYTGMVTS